MGVCDNTIVRVLDGVLGMGTPLTPCTIAPGAVDAVVTAPIKVGQAVNTVGSAVGKVGGASVNTLGFIGRAPGWLLLALMAAFLFMAARVVFGGAKRAAPHVTKVVAAGSGYSSAHDAVAAKVFPKSAARLRAPAKSWPAPKATARSIAIDRHDPFIPGARVINRDLKDGVLVLTICCGSETEAESRLFKSFSGHRFMMQRRPGPRPCPLCPETRHHMKFEGI